MVLPRRRHAEAHQWSSQNVRARPAARSNHHKNDGEIPASTALGVQRTRRLVTIEKKLCRKRKTYYAGHFLQAYNEAQCLPTNQ